MSEQYFTLSQSLAHLRRHSNNLPHVTHVRGAWPFFSFAVRLITHKGTVTRVENIALVLNLVASCVMVGVIWFVQIVHYPLLSIVPVESATSVAVDHQRRTGLVVGLPMAVEGVTTLILLWKTPDDVTWWLPWIAAIFLAVALGCTIFLSVPRHERMALRPDAQVGRELVLTNWPRTIAWTARGVLTTAMLLQVLAS